VQINLNNYISGFSKLFLEYENMLPWHVTNALPGILEKLISTLGSEFKITGNIAIHKSAVIEQGVVLKGPLIILENCFIGANAYLREGVYLGSSTKIGPGCEIKQSIIFSNTSLAHFNYVGDSIIGDNVNFEAGAVIANHYNERNDKKISVIVDSKIIDSGVEKFGALVGDHSKIGANAVLSPGTILLPNSIVKRLELIEQLKK
jgi:UDP-N-acetylglucosamine diphosphorylase / glucose-1-phosphate thymidylyltransferase / UDP-N-acetylgalactosamine diphosphorylase / glucosamine-1-phosphate N-acetyltransferase / galactosamine-1-phosphate N-acetyltransferase